MVVVERAAAVGVVEAGSGGVVDEVGGGSGSVVSDASTAAGASRTGSSPLSPHPPRANTRVAMVARVHAIALDLTNAMMPRPAALSQPTFPHERLPEVELHQAGMPTTSSSVISGFPWSDSRYRREGTVDFRAGFVNH
jgi:hypothetical protein